MKKIIYICSPLKGDIKQNIANAREYCKKILGEGHGYISTHLLFDGVLDDNEPEERNAALEIGLQLLLMCDELRVFGTIVTEGMEKEISFAEKHWIPVTM